MKNLSAVAAAVMFFSSLHSPVYGEGREPYRVKVGDMLSVAVLGHPEMTETARVMPDGAIPFFFVGVLPVEGLALDGISENLTRALAGRGMPHAKIIVRLVEERKQRFFVYGEVRNPGVYALEGRITLLKAVSMAGGYGTFADRKNVKVMRAGAEGMVFDLDRIVRKGDVGGDPEVLPEDVIVVPQR